MTGATITLPNKLPQNSLVLQWVKDPLLSLVWLRSLLRLRFNPWLGNFSMLWAWPKNGTNKSIHKLPPNSIQYTNNHSVSCPPVCRPVLGKSMTVLHVSLILKGLVDNKTFLRVPVLAQRKQIRLGIKRLRVQSLTLLSRLKIQHCHELWCRSQTQLRSGVTMAVASNGPLA